MATKKSTFSDIELEWAEKQLEEWKDYVNAHPFSTLQDRIDTKTAKNGGIIRTVVATVEQQGKFLQETMKNYLALLKEVDAMREAEQKKVEVRGKGELSSQADKWLAGRK